MTSSALPYIQTWARVHPNDMHEFITGANAQGWAVQAVVAVPGSTMLGVLTGPIPTQQNAPSEEI